MRWSMRWCALIVLSTGYIASFATGIIGFAVTRDLHFLLFISPTVFMPAIYYLVPMDQRQFELRKLKIQAKAQIAAQRQSKKRAPSP